MRKNVFKTLIGAAAAAMVLGAAVGVASSIDKAPARAEAADNATVYVIRNYGWTDLRIHYWGGSSSSSWDTRPYMEDTGVNATRGGQTGRVYKYDIPDDTTSFCISGRENNQDKQTKDYTTWNPNGNNAVYFSSWDSGANKAVLGACEYKNTSPAASTNTFYVYDSAGNLGDSLEGVKVYGFGEGDTIKPMSWPGTHDGVTAHSVPDVSHIYKVQLSTSYPNFIMNGNSKQTVNVTLGDHAGQVLYIFGDTDGEGHYNVNWCSLDDLTVSNGTYLRGDWTNGWSVQGQLTMALNPGAQGEVMVEGLNLGAGGRVKVVTYTNHWPEWHDPSTVGTQDPNYPVDKDSSNNATVEKTGTYNLYVNTSTWAYWFNPTANVDLEKATEFAEDFNDAIEGICIYQGGTNPVTLGNEWSSQAGIFDSSALSEGARTLLQNATTSSTVAALGEFAALYDYVYGKYGYKYEWDDFASRTPAEIKAVEPVVPGFIQNNENNAWIWIIVATAVAGLGVGTFFFIKRRKEDR